MNNINSRRWLVITVVFAVAVTTLVLAGIVTNPWRVMPELGADGGKNIFTYLYHSLHGHGIWFTGMNYPYGEHIVYTDAQPILSVPLSYFKDYLSIGRALAIMWWFIAFSYVVSIVYCFKILRKFQVAPVIAMLFAALITVCSPQVLRISGHYALSFCGILPMLFYFTLQYHTKRQWRHPLYIFLLGCFSVFLHPYFAAVALIWAGCYAAANYISAKDSFINKAKHVLPMFLATGTVLLVFGTFMKLTDPLAATRPITPYGILNNCTHIKDILSSGYSPFWDAVKQYTHFSKISYGGEGYTYVSLSAIMAVCFMLGLWLFRKKNNNRAIDIITPSGFQPIWLIMAFIALLFGMGAPFIWHMEWLLNYASMFRQFRTLGRFSWIFYYIITIYGAVVIYSLYEQYLANNKKALAYTIMMLGIGIWTIEACGYATRTHAAVTTGEDNYNIFVSKHDITWPQFLASHNYKKEDFQAILVLPFFATGTEKLWLSSDENISAWSIAMGIKAGMQLQLPMVDIMMSRSSWLQTLNQVKTVGGPYTQKPVLDALPNNKPFLLLHTDYAPLTPDQAYLLSLSTRIDHYLHCTVYVCYPDKIRAGDNTLTDTAFSIAAHMQVADTSINSLGTWYVNHYDDRNYNATPFGVGALQYATNIGGTIATVPITPATDSQLYEISCWFQVNTTDYSSPECVIEALDAAGNTISTFPAPTKESTDNFGTIVKNGKETSIWLRCSAYVNLPARTKYMRYKMLNFAEQPYLALDELMIRPADATILSKLANGQVMANNHLLLQKKLTK